MKRRLTILAAFLAIAIILLMIPVIACAAVDGPHSFKTDLYWKYDPSNKTLTITTGANGTGSMLDFNDTDNKIPWQKYCTSIEVIRIEEGVTNIGAHAFDCNMSKVTKVSLPSSLTKIGDCAFYGCSALTEICIPQNVISIGFYAFGNCTKLTGITLPVKMSSIGEYAFSGLPAQINVWYAGSQENWAGISIGNYNSGLTNAVIHYNSAGGGACGDNLSWSLSNDGVLTITGTGSMYDYLIHDDQQDVYTSSAPWGTGIRQVVLSEGVTSVGDGAFLNCTNVIAISLPSTLENIGSYAFSGCNKFTSITFPVGLKSVAAYAFSGCTNMKVIYYSGTQEQWSTLVHSIGIGNGPILSDNPNITMSFNPGVSGTGTMINQIIAYGKPYTVPECEFTFPHQGYGFVHWVSGGNVYNPGDVLVLYSHTSFTAVWNDHYEPAYLYDAFSYADEVNNSKLFRLYTGDTFVFPDPANSAPNGWQFIGWAENQSTNVFSPGQSYTVSLYGQARHFAGIWKKPLSQTLNWSVNNGVLSITGTGDIDAADIRYYSSATGGGFLPWYEKKNEITSIVIGEGITGIGNDAFYGLNNIQSISLPSTVQAAKVNFNYLSGVITVAESNSSLACQNGMIWEKATERLVYFNNKTQTDVVIPDGIQTLTSGVFYQTRMTSVTIPQSVTVIERSVFTNTSLQTVHYTGSKTDWESIDIGEWNPGLSSATIEAADGTVYPKCGDSVYYSYENGTLHIFGEGAMYNYKTSYISPIEKAPWVNYTISEIIIDKGVTGIGNCAFISQNITAITLPEGLVSIGSQAFANCRNLQSVTFPDELTSIGENAFYECSKLNNVSLPSGITSIESGTFKNCSALENMTLPNGLVSIGNNAFYSCTLLNLKSLPNSVRTIGNSAFENCYKIEITNFPNSLKTIGDSSFKLCNGLISKELVFHDGLLSIGENAFYMLGRIPKMTIPDSIVSIGAQVVYDDYYGQDARINIAYAGSPNQWTWIDINEDNGAILQAKISYGKSEDVPLVSFSLGDAGLILGLGDKLFLEPRQVDPANATFKLTWSSSDDSVVSVDKYGMITGKKHGTAIITATSDNTSSGDSISATITGSVHQLQEHAETAATCTDQGYEAYWECTECHALFNHEMTETITEPVVIDALGHEPVSDPAVAPTAEKCGYSNGSHCSRCNEQLVEQTKIPQLGTSESIVSFDACGPYLYYLLSSNGTLSIYGSGEMTSSPWRGTGTYTDNITSVYISDKATSIVNEAFKGCREITNVRIPDSVVSIGTSAFENCYKLNNLTLPPHITSIAQDAFNACIKLESITIPSGVTSLGERAFYCCDKLAEVSLPTTLKTLERMAFSHCIALTEIIIPSSVESIGGSAFNGCRTLSSINIPDSVESIGYSAFENCADLISITIPNSVTTIGTGAFQNNTTIRAQCDAHAITWATENNIPFVASHIWGQTTYLWDEVNACTASHHCTRTNCNVSEDSNGSISSEATTPATCTNQGEMTYTASFEDDWCTTQTKTAVIPALTHDWQEPVYEWNSDKSKVTARRICKNDDSHVETETVDATAKVTTAATCETDGVRTFTSNAFNNTAFTKQTKTEAIPQTGHDWNTPVYNWKADKTEVTASRTCKNDSTHKQTETVGVSSAITTPATCEDDGVRTYTSSTFENNAFKAQTTTEAIPKTGHDWNTPSYKWSADNKEVTASRTCKNDSDHKQTETVGASSAIITPATCETDGVRTYTSSSFENNAFTAQTTTEAIPKTEHSWGQTIYVWSDNKSSVTASRTCNNNESHVETETASATAEVTTAATCEADGLRTYTSSAFENEAFAVQTTTEAIQKTGHSWSEPTYVWSDDKSSVTASRTCNNNGSHVETETANATAEVTTAATCEADGLRTYTSSSFENNAFTAQTTTEAIPKTEHSWGKPTYVWSENKSSVTASRTCNNNESHVETETANATAEVTTAATCEADGLMTYTSNAFSNKAFSVQTTTAPIPASGHSWGQATYVWSEDKSSVTASRTCNNNGSHVETETANVTDEVTTAATCEIDGVKTYSSEAFSNKAFTVQKTTEAIPKTGHSWGQATYVWSEDNSSVTATRICAKDTSHIETQTVKATSEITTKPTCTTAGEKTYTGVFSNPAFAQQTKTETIGALGHDEVTDAAVAATCTLPGKTEGKHCSRCNKVLVAQTVVPALGHQMTEHIAAEATCTEPGNSAYWSCERCSKYFSDASGNTEINENSWIIASPGHTFSVWAPTKVPTCTEAGEESRTCFVCLMTETRPVKATGHSPSAAAEENRIEATCTSTGSYDAVVFCSVCGEEISREKKTIGKLAHTRTEPCVENQVAGNCRDEGSYDEVVFCAVCGEEISRVKKTTGKTNVHTPGSSKQENVVAATCGKDGSYNEVTRCTTCGKVLESTPHTIAKTGSHTAGSVKQENAVAADCKTKTNGGYDEVTRCTVCGAEMSRTHKTVAYAHTPGEAGWEYVTPASCTAAGKYDEVVYCTVCRAELRRTPRIIQMLDHSLEKHERVEATEKLAGTEEYWECTGCKKKFSDAEGKNEIAAAGIIPIIEKPVTPTAPAVSGGSDGNQPEKTVDKVEAFVTRCYQVILGRDPDAGGLAYWSNNLKTGTHTADKIITGFMDSDEFRNKNLGPDGIVETLYKAMLGRGSDPDGKAFWVGQLSAGKTHYDIISGFCGSIEFGNLCKEYGIRSGAANEPASAPAAPAEEQQSQPAAASDPEGVRAFVTRCYEVILGRSPDAGGLDYWSEELLSGRKAAAEIIHGFMESDEFHGKNLSREDTVETLYRAMLGRGSDADGKAHWVGKLESGEPVRAIINGFCNSVEFRGICSRYGIIPGSVK